MLIVKCPNCGSEDVVFLKKKQQYFCEDCSTFFASKNKKRIFFSYGHDHNSALVERLMGDLNGEFDIWFDKSQIKQGDDWRRSITDGILESDGIVCFLSKHSVRKPGVCLDEIKIALNLKYGNIITVLLEEEESVDIPSSISSIQWLDLSEYEEKGEAYYESKKAELIESLRGDRFLSFEGEITDIGNWLHPISSNAKEQVLLKNEYFPRKWLDATIEEFIDGEDSALMLFGCAGFGKSSYIAHISHYYHRIIAGVFLEWDKPEQTQVSNVIKSLAFKISTRVVDYRKVLLEKVKPKGNDYLSKLSPDELFNELIIEPLGSLIDGGRSREIIFVDGLDEANSKGGNALAETLANNLHKLPRWFGFIITSRSESTLLSLFSNYRYHEILPSDERCQKDIADFFAWKLPREKYPLSLIRKLVKKANGSFLYASLLVESIHSGYINENSLHIVPAGLERFYYFNLKRLFPDLREYEQTRGFFECVIALPDIPRDLIKEIIGLDAYEFRRLLKKVSAFIGEIKATNSPYGNDQYSYFDFIHKTFADYIVTESSGDFYVDIDSGMAKLIVFFRNRFSLTGKSLIDSYIRNNIVKLFIGARKFDELTDFMLGSPLPLFPYFEAMVDFPADYDLSRLLDYLWNNAELLSFLSAEQTQGNSILISLILSGFAKSFGLASFNRDLFEIYVDIVHLSGDYQKSVSIYEEYLSKCGKDELNNDAKLIKYQIRMIHHSMFFKASDELIHKAKELLPFVEKESKEHLELLFLIGGNLGLLNGDFDNSLPYLAQGMEIARRKEDRSFILRFARKISDIHIVRGEYEKARDLLLSLVDINHCKSRYELYLLGVLSDCLRLMGNYQTALEVEEILESETAKRGMTGWLAHAHLLKSLILIFSSPNDESIAKALGDSFDIYRKTNHQWGLCNCYIVNSIHRMKNGIVFMPMLLKAEEIAMRMAYNYELGVVRLLKEGNEQMIKTYHLLML